jgi:UDP-N-acetylglucosamine 2-epimerase (non-hydrolysing)
VPEEVNRRVIDHCSDLLMAYTARSREHLLAEGIAPQRAVVIGNPIFEVLGRHADRRRSCSIVSDLGLERGRFVLVTAHRQENVDVPARLRMIGATLAALGNEFGVPVIVSVHPRTADRLRAEGVKWDDEHVRTLPPLGFHDFVALEEAAMLLVTDSGTVQEEGCILGVPAVTIRETTERPETVECGSNVVAGVETASVLAAARLQLLEREPWRPPLEYLAPDVSSVAAAHAIGTPVW